MSRATRDDRIEAILSHLAQHPRTPYTIAELAAAVGRDHTERFGNDLAAARHAAAEHGDLISRCAKLPGRAQLCLLFLPSGAERGLGGPGERRQFSDVRTRVRNLAETEAYMVANATLPWDRLLAELGANACDAFLAISRSRDAAEAAMRANAIGGAT